jgi:predicted Zn-dependent protease
VENLASDLAATGLVCTVGRPVPLPQDAYDRRRNQYLANALLGLARMAHALANPHARVLDVTEADLYADELNFVFGIAQSRGWAAVISLCRLGLGADPPLRRECVLKEAVHELGHTLGLNHCPNANASCISAIRSPTPTARKASSAQYASGGAAFIACSCLPDRRHATIATALCADSARQCRV